MTEAATDRALEVHRRLLQEANADALERAHAAEKVAALATRWSPTERERVLRRLEAGQRQLQP